MHCINCDKQITLADVARRDMRLATKPAIMFYPVYTCRECHYRPRHTVQIEHPIKVVK